MANRCGGQQETIELLSLGLGLVDLPTDVLLYIFQFCDSASLRKLSITCKRLNNVASEDYVWTKLSNNCIITNHLSREVLRRSFSKLKSKERCRISVNWRNGVYEENVYSTQVKYMPWLHLEEKVLWISRGRSILALQRLKNSLKMQAPLHTIQMAHTDDISRFVKIDHLIFSGGKDKLICGWCTLKNKLVLCQRSNHIQDIQDLDCKRNILVTGSKDNTIKVWQVEEEAASLHCAQTVRVSDRVWCVALDPALSCIAVGSAGYYGVHPLHLFDLDSGVEKPVTKCVLKNGAAVFDIHWECPSTLITCGFDTITRLWDIRVGSCVASWVDPFGAPGYCLATDLRCSVLCGTAHHGRAQLWDKRTCASVQAYFGQSGASSPVYSLSFDPSQLIIAQDSCINVLDFSRLAESNSPRADYRSYWDGGKT